MHKCWKWNLFLSLSLNQTELILMVCNLGRCNKAALLYRFIAATATTAVNRLAENAKKKSASNSKCTKISECFGEKNSFEAIAPQTKNQKQQEFAFVLGLRISHNWIWAFLKRTSIYLNSLQILQLIFFRSHTLSLNQFPDIFLQHFHNVISTDIQSEKKIAHTRSFACLLSLLSTNTLAVFVLVSQM